MKIQAAPREHYSWLQQRTGCSVTDDFRAIEAMDGDRIRGMVGYAGWAPNSVQCHMAVDSPMVWRHLLGPAIAYPFVECDRGVLLATVNATNWRSLRMVKRLGFRLVGRVVDGFSEGQDLLLLELRRDQCAWLKHKKEAA